MGEWLKLLLSLQANNFFFPTIVENDAFRDFYQNIT